MIKKASSALGLFLVLAFAPARAAERPIVVELFTSEGCSSCPPADALLAELAARPGILALSFHVDYWDRLGWKDPFSSSSATARQQQYAKFLGIDGVYTPQIVIDGRWQAVGSDRGEVERALAAARRAPASAQLVLSVDHGRARVALGAGAEDARGSVLLIGFDRRHVDKVERGENEGRSLSHVDVVRGFAEIGRLDGETRSIEATVPWHAERLAAIIHDADGHVLGAAVADPGSS